VAEMGDDFLQEGLVCLGDGPFVFHQFLAEL
jgi:hypothetical protein